MTVPNQVSFDDSVHLSLGDISVGSTSNPITIWLTIKQSKTDPFRAGVTLCLSHTESIVCPVKAMLPYLAVRGSSLGPLFTFSDGTYLTRQWFKAVLLATLKQAGLDNTKYNTHSFRIGAAALAKLVGISDVHIQLLGRWKSSAYQRLLPLYLKSCPSRWCRPPVWYSCSNTRDRHKGYFTVAVHFIMCTFMVMLWYIWKQYA